MIKAIIPVLPSEDIERDVNWYVDKIGFEIIGHDAMYAVLKKETHELHLQWHANTTDDPLNGGSVIRIWVDDIEPLIADLVEKGHVSADKIQRNTAWGTHELGLYDLNKNAIIFMQDV